MAWLNNPHLRYFWLAAREGGIRRAACQLRLTHTTMSEQLHPPSKRPLASPTRLVVGIAEVVPKLIAKHILDPAERSGAPVSTAHETCTAPHLVLSAGQHLEEVRSNHDEAF